MPYYIDPKNVVVRLATFNLVTGPIPKIEVRDRATRMRFPRFGMTGSMHQVRNVTATMTFPSFSIKGSAIWKKPEPTYLFSTWEARQTVKLQPYELTHFRPTDIDGVLTFGTFGTVIRLDVPNRVNATFGFGKFGFEGRGIFPNVVIKGPSFPSLALDGEIFVPPLRVSGQMGLPAFGTSSIIHIPPVIDDAVTFPVFGFDGYVDPRFAVEGELTFPAFGMQGYGIPLPAVLGMASFAAFQLLGTLERDKLRVLGGPMQLPAFGTAGRLEQPILVQGMGAFSVFGAEGWIEQPIVVIGDPSFPSFSMIGLLRTTKVDLEGLLSFPTFSTHTEFTLIMKRRSLAIIMPQ